MKLHKHVLESNLLEGVANTGPLLQNHLLAARCVELAAEATELIHPRILHSILFYGVALPLEHAPGEYRHCNVRVSDFNPPSPASVAGYMELWWGLALEDDPWSSHAHFEAIHPFPDGNGRVGRLTYWNQQLLMGLEPELILAVERYAYFARLEQWRDINWDFILKDAAG